MFSTDPRSSVQQTVTLAPGTRIERVMVELDVKPPGVVTVEKVAEVRSGPSGAVIDFGRMRTVSGFNLTGSAQPSAIYAWLGAAFATSEIETTSAVPYAAFSETLTERLLVTGAEVTVAKVKTSSVTLPGAPSDVELLVGGRRVWFQGGELKRGGQGKTPSATEYFVAVVDVTEVVIAAAAIDPAVVIELRAATPGALSLAVDTTITRVHAVAFPEGAERVVTFDHEGSATLDLPLPGGSGGWQVAEVWIDVAAKLDGLRVTPPVGPDPSTAAELVLDAEHPVAVRLPAAALTQFGSLAGFRLPLRVESGSAELAAVVLAAAGDEPGLAIGGGELDPVALDAAPAVAWHSLSLRRPLRSSGAPLWLAIQVSRGRVVMQLAASGTTIRRGRPGGPWRPFSSGVAVVPQAAVRVIGEPTDGPPLPALEATLAGAPAARAIPTADGTPVQFVASSPVVPAGGKLSLALVASAPGVYRFSQAQVYYRVSGDA